MTRRDGPDAVRTAPNSTKKRPPATRHNTEHAHELDGLVVDHVLFVFREIENIFEERRVGEHAALHVLEGILDEAEGPFFLADACVAIVRTASSREDDACQ